MNKTPLKKKNYELKKSPLKKSGNSLKSSTGLKKGNGLKKSYTKLNKFSSKEKEEEDKLLRAKRTEFFRQCEELLPSRSEVSEKRLPPDNRATRHHLFLKSDYPEIQYSFRGILSCTFDEHTELHNDLECFTIAAERRKWMLEHWEELVKESLEWEIEFMKNKIRTDDTTDKI